jgi:1-acyl-sn-glycerol-3-phosphate acyltransferase
VTLYRAVRAVAGPILRVVWRLEVVGAENMPSGAAIVVANHDSLSDPFFLGAALDRPLHFLAKRELWSNRIVGRVLDGLGGIPVERRRGDLTAVAALARVLERHPYDRDTLAALVGYTREQNDFRQALVYARRLVQIEPANAEVHALVQRLEIETRR